MEIDFQAKVHAQGWDCSRSAIACGGLLKHSDNLLAVREGRLLLALLRQLVILGVENENERILDRLFGQIEHEEMPYIGRWYYETFQRGVRLAERNGDIAEVTRLKELSSDCLVRVEAHDTREISRAVNELERFQRMRKDQPVPPTSKVQIDS